MCAIWKARMAFRLPICWAPSAVTTAVVSSRLLEMTMVLPMATDSSGSVSSVRHADGTRERDVVVGEDIAGESFEGLVELAGSVEEAGLEEALDDVVLGLLDPGALCAEGADVLARRWMTSVAPTTSSEALAASAGGNLEDVTPDVVDGLELESAGDALGIALFDVEGGGEPEVGLDVGAPAIEVVELACSPSSVPEKSPLKRTTLPLRVSTQMRPKKRPIGALAVDGSDVEDGGGGVAEKVVADEAEGVVLAIEAVGVHEQHLDEARFVEGEVKAAAEAGEEGGGVLEEAELAVVGGSLGGGLVDLVRLVADDLGELDAGEEVLVGLGDLAEDGIRTSCSGCRSRPAGARSLTVLTTSFSRTMALSMRAFWPAVSLRDGRTSSFGFFLPTRGKAAEAGSAVAMMAASNRPAVGMFPEESCF